MEPVCKYKKLLFSKIICDLKTCVGKFSISTMSLKLIHDCNLLYSLCKTRPPKWGSKLTKSQIPYFIKGGGIGVPTFDTASKLHNTQIPYVHWRWKGGSVAQLMVLSPKLSNTQIP